MLMVNGCYFLPAQSEIILGHQFITIKISEGRLYGYKHNTL